MFCGFENSNIAGFICHCYTIMSCNCVNVIYVYFVIRKCVRLELCVSQKILRSQNSKVKLYACKICRYACYMIGHNVYRETITPCQAELDLYYKLRSLGVHYGHRAFSKLTMCRNKSEEIN